MKRVIQLVSLICLMWGGYASKANPLFLVRTNGKSGFVNAEGRLIISPSFHAASEFSDGVAVVMPGPQTGAVIDDRGRELSKLALWKVIEPFSEGLAAVMDHQGLWGFVDKKGQLVVPKQFSSVQRYSEGLSAASNRSLKSGWIDKKGEFVISPKYDGAGDFKEGLARFSLGKKCGYLDKSGKILIEPLYVTGFDFSEGLALVWDGETKCFLDRTGRAVVRFPQGSSVQPFQEGLAAVSFNGSCRFINRSGETVLTPPYDAIGSFSERLAPVRVGKSGGGKWGCINKSGELVIPAEFSVRPVFRNGLARIETSDGVGYIKRTGAWVWKPSR